MIYICGDSFGVSDAEYGDCWVDIVAGQFLTGNLCQIAATNLLIAQQVDQAIAASADFVIVQCTSVTRSEKLHNGKYVPFSYHTASTETTPFQNYNCKYFKTTTLNFLISDWPFIKMQSLSNTLCKN